MKKLAIVLGLVLATSAAADAVEEYPQMTFNAGDGTLFVSYKDVCFNAESDSFSTTTPRAFCNEVDYSNHEWGAVCLDSEMKILSRPANYTRIVQVGSSDGGEWEEVAARYGTEVTVDIVEYHGAEGGSTKVGSFQHTVPACN